MRVIVSVCLCCVYVRACAYAGVYVCARERERGRESDGERAMGREGWGERDGERGRVYIQCNLHTSNLQGTE